MSNKKDEPRALVVDDDSAIRAMISTIVQREGYVVDQARDGLEAIRMIQEVDYAFILLDLMMPRIDGFGVIQRLTEESPELLGRVVLMTALSPDYYPASLPDVLQKPFDLDRLKLYAREKLTARWHSSLPDPPLSPIL